MGGAATGLPDKVAVKVSTTGTPPGSAAGVRALHAAMDPIAWNPSMRMSAA